ncbi:MAG: prepilin peptidase [Gammaproteobacteria bacterium]|nr:prepilin peptidase [Gammaproteobacteria bacterium]
MNIINLLQASPSALMLSTGVLGLLVGSFLNVVIHRLPKMMEQDWGAQCREFLQLEDTGLKESKDNPYNLITPCSNCTQCQNPIAAYDNIPVLSYLFLRGKCRHCKTPISLRYPMIEILTAIFSVMVAWEFGLTWAMGAALILTWCLIALSMIDFDTQLLPDNITLPLLWLGLGLSLFSIFTDMQSSIIGAMAGYLSLWSIYHIFRLITGKEGMGYGDFKLFAVLGAWLGWQCLPIVILLSSLVGAVVGLSMIVLQGRDKNTPIPFGPYIAIAGWIYLIWGNEINHAYFQFFSF